MLSLVAAWLPLRVGDALHLAGHDRPEERSQPHNNFGAPAARNPTAKSRQPTTANQPSPEEIPEPGHQLRKKG
jgi:hypothetical protein